MIHCALILRRHDGSIWPRNNVDGVREIVRILLPNASIPTIFRASRSIAWRDSSSVSAAAAHERIPRTRYAHVGELAERLQAPRAWRGESRHTLRITRTCSKASERTRWPERYRYSFRKASTCSFGLRPCIVRNARPVATYFPCPRLKADRADVLPSKRFCRRSEIARNRSRCGGRPCPSDFYRKKTIRRIRGSNPRSEVRIQLANVAG
jgi:hypothetical protein